MEIETQNPFHSAQLSARWTGGFAGEGQVTAANFSTKLCLPIEFKGTGKNTTPEDLFLSSMASCYLITFGIILEKSGVKYESLTIEAELHTELSVPAKIREIVLKPQIVTAAETSLIEHLATRVDEFCLISRALNSSVKKRIILKVCNSLS